MVDLLSAFEMLRYWSMEQITAPAVWQLEARSTLTPEGHKYLKQCRSCKQQPSLEPGIHYIALEAEGRR